MMKVIRNPAKRIEFKKEDMIEPVRGETSFKDVAKFENTPREREVDEKLVALENAGKIVGKIQEEIDKREKDLEEKENLLVQKEKELGKMAELWASLNSVNLKELDKNELKNIVSEQEGFVKDLLEHYIESTEHEEKLVKEIEKLKEKPWAGKGSSQINKENKELKARNKELTEEIDKVLGEIEKKIS